MKRRPGPPTSFAVTLGGLFVLGIMAVAAFIYVVMNAIRRAFGAGL